MKQSNTVLLAGITIALVITITLIAPPVGAFISLVVFIGKSAVYPARLFARKTMTGIFLLSLAILFPCLAPILALVQVGLLLSRLAYMQRNLIPIVVGWCFYSCLITLFATDVHAAIINAICVGVISGCLVSADLACIARRGENINTIVNIILAAPIICISFIVDLIVGDDDGSMDADWDVNASNDYH